LRDIFYCYFSLRCSAFSDEQSTLQDLQGSSITYRIAVGPYQGARYSPCKRCPPQMPLLD